MIQTIKACIRPRIISDLRDLVNKNAERYGDKALYVYKQNGTEKTYTYNDMRENMYYLGTAFSKLGLMGKHIAIIGEGLPAYMTTYLATINGGGVIVPLDKDLPDEELVKLMNISEVEAIVYTSAFNNRIAKYASELPKLRYFIPVVAEKEEIKADNIIAYNDVIELGKKEYDGGNRDFENYRIDLSKLCAILFTSGTTGAGKGVMLTHKNLTAATNSSCQSMECDPTCVFVSVLPMNHSYEVTCGHLALSNIGGTTYINDSLKNVMRNFAHFKPNTLILVPLFVETMHKKIWAEIDKKGMRKKVNFAIGLSNFLLKLGIDKRKVFFKQILEAFGGNLRCIICGGAPLEPQLIKDFNAFGIVVLEGYGITECAPLVAVNRVGKERFHTVGTPVDGCRVKTDAPDEISEGELLVSGDNVMLGYYKNEEATQDVFTADGWFKTGDIGHLDSEGYIYITGRKKNIIILSNGKNIYPEELEHYLFGCDMIGEAVVVGRKNAKGEIVITALVYPNQDVCKGKSKDEIFTAIKEAINQINKKLPAYKQIHDLELRDTEFEKTTSRKIKRYKVQ